MITVDNIRAWAAAEKARNEAIHENTPMQHCADIAWGRAETCEEIIAMIDAGQVTE